MEDQNEKKISTDNEFSKAEDINNPKDKVFPLANKDKNETDLEIANTKQNSDIKQNIKTTPVKELPIEKKPFKEFVTDYLMPAIKSEFAEKGKEVKEINLKNDIRPISGDRCWVLYCEVKETCNFWLTFDSEDITSLKSFSLCKPSEKPSILESFLIDEKRITLKLIISRIFQRLNGQKLVGAN